MNPRDDSPCVQFASGWTSILVRVAAAGSSSCRAEVSSGTRRWWAAACCYDPLALLFNPQR